jgi:low affinity Fe/Cu permease
MAIEQIRAEHSLVEDRILLLLRTSALEEYRLWLTRRVAIFVLAATEKLIGNTLSKKFAVNTAKAISSFNKDTLKQNTNFNAPYTAGTQFPIGDLPKLVKDIRCSANESDEQILIKLDIEFEEQKTVHITLPEQSIRQMCLLIEGIAQKAQWLPNANSHNQTPSEQSNLINSDPAVKKLH